MRPWLFTLLGAAFPVALAAQPSPRLTRPPAVMQSVQADYPAEALVKRIAGEVQLWVELDAQGEVTRVELVQSPDRSLADAAVAALLRMRFTPAEVDGVPAPVRISYSYQFKLPDEPVPERPALVNGVVKNDAGQPLPLMTVRAEPQTLLTRTDADGRFTFNLTKPGPYTLYVYGPGIESAQVHFTAHLDETIALKITAHAAPAEQNYETTVRTEAEDFEISRQQLSRDELRAVPGAFGDPLRVLESLPGLGRSPFSTGILVMRGSSPDDSEVFLDGHPIPLLYHFGGGPSIVPPESIGAIALEPGAFPVRFGRATAGIVDIETRPGHTETLHGGAHVSVLDAGATVDGPIDGVGSFRLAARRSYIDVILPWVTRAVGRTLTLTLVPRYWDYFGRADVNLTDGLKLTLAAHGSDDVLSFAESYPPFSLPSNFQLHTGLQRINPAVMWRLSDVVNVSVSPVVSWLVNHGETPDAFAYIDTFSVGLRSELQTRFAAHRHVNLGVDITRDAHVFTAPVLQPGTVRYFPSAQIAQGVIKDTPGELTVLQAGVYAEGIFRVQHLRLNPGARIEHGEFSGRAQTSLDPRLSARYELTPTVELKFGSGIYHRLPLPAQLSAVTGNPDLVYERSWQSEVGVEWAIDNAHSLDVQTYYKFMDNLTVSTGQAIATLQGSARPLVFMNSGEGQAMGVEILLRRKLSNGVMGWISYSLSLAQRRNQAEQPWSIYVRDQTHNLNILASIELPWRLRVGGRFRYVTGYPVQDIIGATFDADSGNYIPQTSPRVDRLPPFNQLDVRIDWQFGNDDGVHGLVFLDVQNVTNAQNAEYYQYSNDYAQRYAYPGLPFLPSLGVEVKF